MSKTIIIDANSVGYAMQYGGAKLTTGDMETQAVFGFVKKLRQLRISNPSAAIMVLWDGKAQWRFDLHPDYKSNRDSDPKKVANKAAYAKQRPYISRATAALGIRQITVATHEADDMAGYFVSTLSANPSAEIELLTGDEDWIQLVRPNVSWRDPREQHGEVKIVTFDTLMEKTGFATPYAFLEGKCLQGDTSDVIPGIPEMGKKTASEFLAEHGSVRAFWEKVDNGSYKPKARKSATARSLHPEQFLASPEGRAIFGLNLRMMQLLKVAPPEKSAINVVREPLNKDAFIDVCAELSFSTITRNVDAFLAPFRG